MSTGRLVRDDGPSVSSTRASPSVSERCVLKRIFGSTIARADLGPALLVHATRATGLWARGCGRVTSEPLPVPPCLSLRERVINLRTQARSGPAQIVHEGTGNLLLLCTIGQQNFFSRLSSWLSEVRLLLPAGQYGQDRDSGQNGRTREHAKQPRRGTGRTLYSSGVRHARQVRYHAS